tara:strand:+ start:68 stop:439 length:372 start_codon:yes stop_codon:yes gene_type:complete
MITFGLLGLGRVIEKRVANVFLKELNNSKVIAVFDTNRKKNNFFSKLFKCKKNNSINSFLNNRFDFIYIATESGNHYKDIKKCFKKNHNVIVEKPPVLKITQLEELNKIAKKKKTKILFYISK